MRLLFRGLSIATAAQSVVGSLWAHAVRHTTSHYGSRFAQAPSSGSRNPGNPHFVLSNIRTWTLQPNPSHSRIFQRHRVQTPSFDVLANNAGCNTLALLLPGANIGCRAVRGGSLHRSNVLPRASIGSHPFARLQPSPRDHLIGDPAQLRRQDTWRHRCRQT
jgi:hypothetical protein